jgi:hypothetical protein
MIFTWCRRRSAGHPFLERLIGSIRRECLDHLLFWTGADLEMKRSDFNLKSFAGAGLCHLVIKLEVADVCSVGMVPPQPHRRSAPKFITMMQADREALEQRVRRLQKELWNQWEYNHSEHCGKQLPHSGACYWPMPDELIGYVEDDLGFGLIRIEIIDRSPVFRADVFCLELSGI